MRILWKSICIATISVAISVLLSCDIKKERNSNTSITKEKYPASVDSLIEKAERNDAQAQYDLWRVFYYGRSVKADSAYSLLWLEKAAENGYSNAQYTLGVLYYSGDIVSKDLGKAVFWYTKASEQGHDGAQFNLALMYENGNGVRKKDISEAMRLYKLAANNGLLEAQIHLGDLYNAGYNIPQNYKEAQKYYLMAAEQGDYDSQYKLGMLLFNQHNYVDAYFWLSLSILFDKPSEVKINNFANTQMSESMRYYENTTNERVRARDQAASFLFGSTIIEIQEKTMEWYSEHQKSNN